MDPKGIGRTKGFRRSGINFVGTASAAVTTPTPKYQDGEEEEGSFPHRPSFRRSPGVRWEEYNLPGLRALNRSQGVVRKGCLMKLPVKRPPPVAFRDGRAAKGSRPIDACEKGSDDRVVPGKLSDRSWWRPLNHDRVP